MRSPVFVSKRRPDSLSTFVLTVGIVDAVMGGVSGHAFLLMLGLLLMGGAVALRWSRSPKLQRQTPARSAQRLLPDKTSRPSLSLLMDAAKRS